MTGRFAVYIQQIRQRRATVVAEYSADKSGDRIVTATLQTEEFGDWHAIGTDIPLPDTYIWLEDIPSEHVAVDATEELVARAAAGLLDAKVSEDGLTSTIVGTDRDGKTIVVTITGDRKSADPVVAELAAKVTPEAQAAQAQTITLRRMAAEASEAIRAHAGTLAKLEEVGREAAELRRRDEQGKASTGQPISDLLERK